MDYKKIKDKSIIKLKSNYLVIIIAMLLYGLIEEIFRGTSFLISNQNMNIFFSIIITGLLYEGFMQIIIKTYRGKSTNIMDLFNKTDLFWKTAAVTVLLTALTVICTAAEFLAGSTLYVFVNHQADLNIFLSSFMILAGVLLCTCIAVFYLYLMISFSEVYKILYDNEKMSVLDIFNKSMDLLEEKKVDYVLFNLPYILWITCGLIIYHITFSLNNPGWIIIALVILAVIIFWEIPNMLIANVGLYDELKKIDNKKTRL